MYIVGLTELKEKLSAVRSKASFFVEVGSADWSANVGQTGEVTVLEGKTDWSVDETGRTLLALWSRNEWRDMD